MDQVSNDELAERRQFIYNLLRKTRPYLNDAERRIIGENLLQKSLAQSEEERSQSRCSQRGFTCSTPTGPTNIGRFSEPGTSKTAPRPRAGTMFSNNNLQRPHVLERNLSQVSIDNFTASQRRSHPNVTEGAPHEKRQKMGTPPPGQPQTNNKTKRTNAFLQWRNQKTADSRRKKGLAAALPPRTDDEKMITQMKTRASLPAKEIVQQFNFVKKITEAEDNVVDIKNELEEIQKTLDKINFLSKKTYVL